MSEPFDLADTVVHIGLGSTMRPFGEWTWDETTLARYGTETAADGALTAWAAPGALDRTVQLSSGPAPAADHLVELTADLTVHAWDLAAAVGGVTALDPELVAAAWAYAEEHLGEDGVPGVIAPAVEVPPGTDLQTRLLARFGRRA